MMQHASTTPLRESSATRNKATPHARPGPRRRVAPNHLGYLLSVPAVALVLLVSFVPIGLAFRTSLYETRYLELRQFVGLANYWRILLDPTILANFRNSLIFVLGSLALAIPLGVFLAILLDRAIAFRTVYRVILIAPWVISQTIVALLWVWLLNGRYGPMLAVLESIGFRRVDLLADVTSAMPAVIAANVWQSYPFALVLVLAALQTVPAELYEALAVDGGSVFAKFRYVTFPYIRPTLLVVTIMLSLHYFNMVTLVLTMTAGGPFNATEVVSLRAFKEGFQSWHIGIASALGILVFLANVVLSLAYMRVLKRSAFE
jgi:multiple sugar transport system permease protein